MRRKDREVTDFSKIIDIIQKCSILRLGLADGDYPYIVPMNFAFTVEDKEITFYIHGALTGRKYELMKKLGCCSFELDYPYEVIENKDNATMHYQSVMGKAKIEMIEDVEEKNIF